MKILPPEQSYDAEVVLRFHQEGRAAAQLDHENIARVYTIDHDERYHFIAFEYIEGTTIRRRVERGGPLPVAEAINYTLQIAGALVHAAERGVVHRDIKPSNIIVTSQGRAKLVDMGLARRFEREGGTDDGLTQSGMTLGTFDYISPEQARDPRDVNVRSDLYSLGCTLFHMLTGRPPFPEGTVLQKLLQHQEEPPPDVRTLNPAVPGELAAIILKLMAKDRDRRYQTPEQLARDLLTLAGALGLPAISPEGLVWMNPKPQAAWERHLFWGAPTLVLLLVVVGLIWWGQEPAPTDPAGSTDPGAGVLTSTPSGSSKSILAPPSTGSSTTPSNVVRESKPKAIAVPSSASNRDPARSRTIEIHATEDLSAKIAAAPRDAVLILVDDETYELRSEPRAPFLNRDLKIQAGPGAAEDQTRGPRRAAQAQNRGLLAFRGGRVALEGLEFVVAASNEDEPVAAISAEDVELTLTRCVFRR